MNQTPSSPIKPETFALIERLIGFDTTSRSSNLGLIEWARDYLKGYGDNNAYFNNPLSYLPGLDGPYLDLLRNHSSINIVTGQGAYEVPDASRRLSGVLLSKGIPHSLDLWGYDVNHDWPWWRKMLPHYIDRLGW